MAGRARAAPFYVDCTIIFMVISDLLVVCARRGAGLGHAILGLLESQVCALGVVRLHLLTTTVAPFFAANGYRAADRKTAPAPVAASAEFTSLCPANAAYLVKPLAHP